MAATGKPERIPHTIIYIFMYLSLIFNLFKRIHDKKLAGKIPGRTISAHKTSQFLAPVNAI